MSSCHFELLDRFAKWPYVPNEKAIDRSPQPSNHEEPSTSELPWVEYLNLPEDFDDGLEVALGAPGYTPS